MEINFTLNYQAQSLNIEPLQTLSPRLKLLCDLIGLTSTYQEDSDLQDAGHGGEHGD